MKQKRQQTGGHSPEEDWAQRLRDHLAGYEAPVPDDLWEKIEARLPKEVVSPTPPKKKEARIVPLWARWAAVAAVFVGGLVLWNVKSGMWNENSHEADQTAAVLPLSRGSQRGSEQAHSQAERKAEFKAELKAELEAELEADQTTPNPSYSGGETDTPEGIGLKAKAPALLAEERPMESEKKAEEKPLEPISSGEKSAEEPKESTSPEGKPIMPISSDDKPISSEEKPNETEKSPEDVIRELDQKIAEYKQHHNGSAAINLYASNGFGHQSYRNGVLMSQELLSNYDYYTNPDNYGTRAGDSPVYLANHEERQKFYQPISFGLSVNIPISSGFSVSSGVVYTRLRSDFTSIANSLVYERQQTLHYVGIPLTVQYNVWQWRGLNVYATAGGQADFNVKACVTTEGTETKLEKDNLQWSVNAAAGVQYNFIPQLGIYVEPGIKHYFDNGSHIRNFFKHRPTNFNLQIGLRLNMGKK